MAFDDGGPTVRHGPYAKESRHEAHDISRRSQDGEVILLTMATTLSLAETKAHLSELVARVSTQHERVLVTVHGKLSAVLLAPEDLAALEETVAVLSDPDTIERLAASDAELADGLQESEADLAAAMGARRRLGG